MQNAATHTKIHTLKTVINELLLSLCNTTSAATGASARAGNNMVFLADYTVAGRVKSHTRMHTHTHLCPHYAGGNLILSHTNPLLHPHTHTHTHTRPPANTHICPLYILYPSSPPRPGDLHQEGLPECFIQGFYKDPPLSVTCRESTTSQTRT